MSSLPSRAMRNTVLLARTVAPAVPALACRRSPCIRPAGARVRPRASAETHAQDPRKEKEDQNGPKKEKKDEVYEMHIVTNKGKTALVVWPPGPAEEEGRSDEADQKGTTARTVHVKGVVLFMHGFAQGPTAYARMLNQLAEEANVLVVAPCPRFFPGLTAQQQEMVDCARTWRELIHRNALPGITVEGGTNSGVEGAARSQLPVGLLAHSVGGGLAPYVVDAAAAAQQDFAAAHVLAPQVALVVCEYHYARAKGGRLLEGVGTTWGVQYGEMDLLSWRCTVKDLCTWLKGRKVLSQADVKSYPQGTHVGFQDQLVALGEPFVNSWLPWVLGVLGGVPGIYLWEVLKSLLRAAPQDAVPRAADEGVGAGADGTVRVTLPDDSTTRAGYIALAMVVTGLAVFLPGCGCKTFDWSSYGWTLCFDWSSVETGVASTLKVVFGILAVFAWPAVRLYPYEARTQRPESRQEVVRFFKHYLR